MTSTLPSVMIVRTIKASPAKVWAAITQPEQMIRWWGPDAGPTLSAVADVRPGGQFAVVFQLINGDEHNPTGIYQEVVPEEKLVFTWDLPETSERVSLVTFLLRPFEGGTELTLLHEHLPNEEERKSHKQGWKGLLDKLPIFLEIPNEQTDRLDI
ncbi:SRPBCC domain-containing protein [Rhizobium sp. PL01]|uniref:SRPBCC family protein n=1 Tax=Rhizobium sp. PL01 TaxID=3085631 RepID=UPI0029821CD9|nr:SRPBCC domain-containing protein [Rhizobium sp. PL01]MDW5316829.1 SRPBCC domain-containing protein [Rhizobium sp. PL01]